MDNAQQTRYDRWVRKMPVPIQCGYDPLSSITLDDLAFLGSTSWTCMVRPTMKSQEQTEEGVAHGGSPEG